MSEPARPTGNPPEAPPPPAKSASLPQVVEAVFWSFFGVRKGRDMSRDVGTIKPQHVIVVGVLLAALFVYTLIGIVRFILRSS
jgi:hypothetical protein